LRRLKPVYSRHVVSKSERRRLVELLRSSLPPAAELLERAKRAELAKLRLGPIDLLIIDGVPAIVIRGEGESYPTILAAHKLNLRLPTVVVDMGAVPHILNGADVMAPGIVRFDEFGRGAIVYVADEEGGRVFAVGRALVSSSELSNMKRGKAIKTLHYAGDKLWRIIREM